jgi:hypothetical protein
MKTLTAHFATNNIGRSNNFGENVSFNTRAQIDGLSLADVIVDENAYNDSITDQEAIKLLNEFLAKRDRRFGTNSWGYNGM